MVVEELISAVVGVSFHLDMLVDEPAPPRDVRVTYPHDDAPSWFAEAMVTNEERVRVKCSLIGDAWIRVNWQNGTSTIYPLSCQVPPPEQPRIDRAVGESAIIEVPENRTDLRFTWPGTNFESPVVLNHPVNPNTPGAERLVRVLCWLQGDVWVWVYTAEDQPPRIYVVRCGPTNEDLRNFAAGGTFVISVPGGTPRSVAATVPNGIEASPVVRVAIGTTPPAASLSPTASFPLLTQVLADGASGSVAGRCIASGSAWVRVETGEEDWKVYPVTCAVHDQGGGG
ncbi:MAG TPA: hypothetical protein VHG91_08125 [Longimicrobium sp.]|nr:hypothetical protein [Longimicrobium sp.]